MVRAHPVRYSALGLFVFVVELLFVPVFPFSPVRAQSSSNGDLTYHNGDVMHNAVNFLIFWLPTGTNPVDGNPYTFDNKAIDPAAASPSDSNYESLMIRYFNDVCQSSYYALLNQYQGTGDPTLPSGTVSQTGPCSFGGSWVDTRPFPSSNGIFRGTPQHPLKDEDIHDEIDNARKVNGWGIGLDKNEFFVFLPYDVFECQTATILFSFYGGCMFLNSPPPGVVTNNGTPYCAYHSWYPVAVPFATPTVYALVGDYGTGMGGAGQFSCGGPFSPNKDPFADATLTGVAHEQFESVTNPYLGALGGDGWYFNDYAHEIGDECNINIVGTESDLSDVNLNGNPYSIQTMWDNTNSGCDFNTAGPPVFVSIVLTPSPPLLGQATGSAKHSGFKVTYQEAGENGASSVVSTTPCSGCTDNRDTVSFFATPFDASAAPNALVTISPITGQSEEWCLAFDVSSNSCKGWSFPAQDALSSVGGHYTYYDLLRQDVAVQFPQINFTPPSTICQLQYDTAPPTATRPEAQVGGQYALANLGTQTTTVWVVRGSSASVCKDQPGPVPSGVRWEAPVNTWTSVLGADEIFTPGVSPAGCCISYYLQYLQSVQYQLAKVVGNVVARTPSPPSLSYVSFGGRQSTTLSETTPQQIWMDGLSIAEVTSPIDSGWVTSPSVWTIGWPNQIPQPVVYRFTSVATTVIQGGGAILNISRGGVTITIAGAFPNGAPVTGSATGLEGQPPGTVPVSIVGVGFFDVKISGISNGIATVCVTDPRVTPQTDTMLFWNGVSWMQATNVRVSGNTICGDIPVSALGGTPIAIGTRIPPVTPALPFLEVVLVLVIGIVVGALLVASIVAFFVAPRIRCSRRAHLPS